MARRGRNEGSIRKRPDGRWEARAVLTDPDGRRARRSFLDRDRTTVRDRLRDALAKEANGIATPNERLTVGTFLETWLADVVRQSCRPSTISSYTGIVRRHLLPHLGAQSLARLTPQQVQHFLNTKTAAGYSARTVAYVRAVLRQALSQAERWGMVTRNAARLAEPPRVPRHEIRPLTAEQAKAFLRAIDSDRLEALYLVALGVGLRQGELLGLAWSDLDLDRGTLTVRNALQRVASRLILVEPKSVTSRRVVALPDLVTVALRRHRVRQAEERLRAGRRWEEDPRDLVFRTTIGTPLDGITVTRTFQSLLARHGLPRQRFHDLRHACASLLLAEGVAPRVVMETLGHSQIALTLNTYSHVSPALGRAAAERMNTVLDGGSTLAQVGAG